jgi:two-component system, NarL family, nitrate/nitrite response regulator NarL
MADDYASRSAETAQSKPVLVFVICRVRLYYDALIKLLNRQAGMSAIGTDQVADALLPAVEAAVPDVVLLDLGFPDALACALRLVRARPGTRILGFGVDEAPLNVVACAEAGLSGYVPAHASVADLANAARRIARGDIVCSAGMADKLFLHLRSAALNAPAISAEATLTGRQQQVLALIREGLSNKQIAKRLSLGPSTVKNHVHGLLGRLRVGRRAEAVVRTRQGLDEATRSEGK